MVGEGLPQMERVMTCWRGSRPVSVDSRANSNPTSSTDSAAGAAAAVRRPLLGRGSLLSSQLSTPTPSKCLLARSRTRASVGENWSLELVAQLRWLDWSEPVTNGGAITMTLVPIAGPTARSKKEGSACPAAEAQNEVSSASFCVLSSPSLANESELMSLRVFIQHTGVSDIGHWPTPSRHPENPRALNAVPPATAHPATASIPRPLASSSSPAGPPPPPTPYFSRLTPAQHHLVRHAAAALLLKQHHEHKGVHDALHRAIGGFEKMVKTLEAGMESAWRGAREHAPEAVVGTRPSSTSCVALFCRDGLLVYNRPRRHLAELFGTPLKYLTTHEGVDSFHGADPHGTVRIPEFLDHCITAMMQAGASASRLFPFLRIATDLKLVRAQT